MFADIGGIVINIAERGDARPGCIQDLRAENELFLSVRNREGMGFTIFGNESRRDGLVREVVVIEKATFFHVFRGDRREGLVIARVDELVNAFDGHVLSKGSKNRRQGVARRRRGGGFLDGVYGTRNLGRSAFAAGSENEGWQGHQKESKGLFHIESIIDGLSPNKKPPRNVGARISSQIRQRN